MIFKDQTQAAYALTGWQKASLLVFSFFIVAFGQPAWNEWLGLLAAVGGFACFWRVLLSVPNPKERFCMAMGWYTAVQIVQFSWFASHPYLYIYGVLLFCAYLMGAQWGLIAFWIKPQTFQHGPSLLAIAGLWTLLEWSRLFILTGLPFNPVGLSLSGALYPLQFASLGGVYGLSFWVILTNLLLLRAWIHPTFLSRWILVGLVALTPYAFGWGHVSLHERSFAKHPHTLSVVLVQTALPIEENMHFQSAEEAQRYVLEEWRQVFSTLHKQLNQTIDLIVLPEYLVPYGTYHLVFPFDQIQQLFYEQFGPVSYALPEETPYLDWVHTSEGVRQWGSNAYIVQALANLFQAHVVIGLEDSVYEANRRSEAYSAAFHFLPGNQPPTRYEKQILVPMGEYIPFHWCREMAASYGITGSFTCGQSAKVFQGPVPFGASICYEEIYGDLMRQNRVQGAELLVNLTNDGWFPHSRLPKQHFDHARLRTVENGIPLARACNTGITGAVDSLGRIIGVLGEDSLHSQDLADSLRLNIPLYHYQTLYTHFGDLPILGLSCLCLLGGLSRRRRD